MQLKRALVVGTHQKVGISPVVMKAQSLDLSLHYNLAKALQREVMVAAAVVFQNFGWMQKLV